MMMIFSVAGIAWVQIRWIRDAINVANVNFAFWVNSCLNDAANALELSGKMNGYYNFPMAPFMNMDTDSSNHFTGHSTRSIYSSGEGPDMKIRITDQSVTRMPGEKPRVVTRDTTINPGSSVEIAALFDDQGMMTIDINHQDKEIDTMKVRVGKDELMEWVRKRRDEFARMNDRMIAELFSWGVLEPGVNEIEKALKRSFLHSPVNTPFEFALIRNGKVSEGIYKKAGEADFLKSDYQVRLFNDNLIAQDIVLSVVFPERTTFILGSMGLMLGGSLLLSVIILTTFAMSLFFIIRQKKVSEIKSDFINNMTHEFKTPIATISLAADTITNPRVINDEASVRHFIGMIKKENNRMNKKVETILQIASLDKKDVDFHFEKISIHAVIERAVETVDIFLKQRNGNTRLSLNASDPVIMGDNEHLLNLFCNLLDNAVKYSVDAPDITIETRDASSGIIIAVEDKGIGMSKSVQSRIFERFYRQASGNIHDVKGFGLGLNYARAIVDAHKGYITVVQSEPGRGSRFEVFLPFNRDL